MNKKTDLIKHMDNKAFYGLKVAKILRHYSSKMFRVKSEKAAMQLRSQAAKRADRCMDAKKHERIGGFVEKCFGENHTFSPIVGEGSTECRMRGKLFSPLEGERIASRARGSNASSIRTKSHLSRATKQDAVLTRVLTSVRNAGRGVLQPSSHQGNHGVTLNLIQGLSMFIKSISIYRCRIKFGMTVSCAKRTVKNLSLFTSHFSREGKRYAFTLAEVLITLGIIGVVAAITISTLSANIKKQRAITQLKKAYSEMSQAVKLSEIDNDEAKAWNYKLNAKDFYETYLKNYLKSTKEVTYGTYNVKYISLNNSACQENWCTDVNGYYIMLANGTVIGIGNYINGNDPKYKSVTIDINGKKGPNKTGIDYFIYTIQERGFVPYGTGFYNLGENAFGTNNDRSKMTAAGGRGCSSTGTGVFCSALILHDNWQIKYNYK